MRALRWGLFSLGAISLLTACGYHAEGEFEGSLWRHRTFSIAPIAEDGDGNFTAALIQALSSVAGLRYCPKGGELLFCLSLPPLEEEHIGFRYDQHKKGNLRHSIIPTETRLQLVALLTLTELPSGRELITSVPIAARVEFDHDYNKSRNGVNIFSLGQLTDYDEAYDAAYEPLMKELAKNIAEYVSEVW